MNDRKKTVLLLLLIFAVFGLVGWRVAGVPNQVTPPPGSTSTTLDGNGQPVASGSNSIQLAMGSSGKGAGTSAKPITVAAPAAVAGRDPFRTAGSDVPVKPAQSKRPSRSSSAIRSSDLDQPVSPLKGDILPTPGNSPVEVRADVPLLKVSGVLAGGPKPIAILQLGDKQFVVGVGDSFGEGYVLKSVNPTQVVVTQGKRSFFLPTIGA